MRFAWQSEGMLRLPPRPAKADADVRAAFVAAGARSGAEHDPMFDAMQLRFLPDTTGGADTPRQVCQPALRLHLNLGPPAHGPEFWFRRGRRTGTPC